MTWYTMCEAASSATLTDRLNRTPPSCSINAEVCGSSAAMASYSASPHVSFAPSTCTIRFWPPSPTLITAMPELVSEGDSLPLRFPRLPPPADPPVAARTCRLQPGQPSPTWAAHPRGGHRLVGALSSRIRHEPLAHYSFAISRQALGKCNQIHIDAAQAQDQRAVTAVARH